MKKLIAILLAVLMICSLFVGCAKTEEPVVEPETETPAVEGEPTAMEKYGFDELDIMAFSGGNIGLWEEMVELFKSYYPGVEVTADISSDIANRIRARMMTDDVPDWVDSSGAEWWPLGAARAGQLLDLSDFFANGVNADGVAMSEVITADQLVDFYDRGILYAAPAATDYFGWWYNVNMFADLGIEAPTTWDELYEVADVLKANDIIPYLVQHSGYSLLALGYPIINNFAGREIHDQCFVTLDEGAWLQPEVLEAITAYDNLIKDGVMSDLSAGADFTAMQVDFVNGRIGMMPNGTWFENEMKEVTPEDFDMAFMPIPAAKEGGKRSIVTTNSGNYVTKDGNNAAALAWLGVIYSDAGQQILAKYGKFPVSKVLDPASVKEYMTEANYSAFEAAQQPDVEFLSNAPQSWYGYLQEAIIIEHDNLVLQEITPEEYCERIEASAEECRQDPEVEIHTLG